MVGAGHQLGMNTKDNKMYYIIKNGNQVLHTGMAEPNTVGTRYELLWFDTEAEMLQYIENNHLEIVEVEDEID
jgi:hypothetical protein